VHGHPANVVVASLDLADVQPGANPNVDAAKLAPKGDRAVDPPPGAVEGGHDPVAGGVDQAATCRVDQPSGQLIMNGEQLAPAAITQPPGLLGRADDVGEQHWAAGARVMGAAGS
jgi:hypothetical protein